MFLKRIRVDMSGKLYLVSLDIQSKEVNEFCFRKCGKILVGGVDLDGLACLPCNTDECPFLEKQMEAEPITFDEIVYNDVYLRKLVPFSSSKVRTNTEK